MMIIQRFPCTARNVTNGTKSKAGSDAFEAAFYLPYELMFNNAIPPELQNLLPLVGRYGYTRHEAIVPKSKCQHCLAMARDRTIRHNAIHSQGGH
jgi:hypothetical protein